MPYFADNLGVVHVQSPFRISFFGGGTDFPDYFNAQKGAVLGVTLNRYSYVVLNSLVRLSSRRIKLSYSQLELADSPDELDHAITKCLLKEHPTFWNGNFLDIHSFADMPSSSGIGSSSSFTVGLLQAMYSLNGQYRTPHELAREAISIERDKLKEKGGWQDQIFAAYGGLNRIDFSENDFAVTPVTIPKDVFAELENSMLFFFTGVKRSSCAIQEKVFNSENVLTKQSYLKKMYELVDVAEQTLYGSGTPEECVAEFGGLLDDAWKLKRKLSSHISTPQIDACYEAAKNAGAYGGKISGAGGGGMFYFIAPPRKHDEIREALSCHGVDEIPARFSTKGSRVLFCESRT